MENLARRRYLEKVHVLSAVRFRESEVDAIVRHGTPRLHDVERLMAGRAASGAL